MTGIAALLQVKACEPDDVPDLAYRLYEAGYVVVPIKPTDAMYQGARILTGAGDPEILDIWKAMIEAAP